MVVIEISDELIFTIHWPADHFPRWHFGHPRNPAYIGKVWVTNHSRQTIMLPVAGGTIIVPPAKSVQIPDHLVNYSHLAQLRSTGVIK